MKRGWITPISLLIVAIILPFVLGTYFNHVLIIVIMWITMSLAWNLLGGFAGQVSFGHALFFGLGAYGGGLVFYHWGISTWWGMLVGPVFAVVIAIPVGLITFRLRGPYFALAMLAMGEIARLIFTNWVDFSGGAVGVMISRTWGAAKMPYYFIILAISVLCFVVVILMRYSKLGYYFLSIREDQDAAEGLGIPTTKYKMYALIPSAFFTGLAGAFYMNYMAYIEPHVVFNLEAISIMMILTVMMGGAGTIWGPVLGATVYVIMAEVFRTIPIVKEVHVLVFAFLVVLIIMFLPDGVLGEWHKIKRFFVKHEQA